MNTLEKYTINFPFFLVANNIALFPTSDTFFNTNELINFNSYSIVHTEINSNAIQSVI